MGILENDVKKILFSKEDIDKRCEEIAKLIDKDYEGKKPLLICVLNGALPFFSNILTRITIPMEYDAIKVSSYDGTETTGKINIGNYNFNKIKNRDVLIVEDIVDTGHTMKALVEYFNSVTTPNSVEILTLLDKPSRREVEVKTKYVGFEVENEFVIGYGLDYNELYRNLPYVGVIKEEAI